MNIFFLDDDPRRAAIYHCDRHVVKMCVEYAQILSTAARSAGIEFEGQYASTHEQHPSVLWAGESYENFQWLVSLFRELLNEYTFRYERQHASGKVLAGMGTRKAALVARAPILSLEECTAPRLAMPDEYKCGSAIRSYRDYYAFDKTRMHKWKNREVPHWIEQRLNLLSLSGNSGENCLSETTNPTSINGRSQMADQKTAEKPKAGAAAATGAKPDPVKRTGPKNQMTQKRLLECKITLGGENYRKEGTKGHTTMKLVKENPGILGSELEKKGGRLADVVWDLRHHQDKAKLKIEEPVPSKEAKPAAAAATGGKDKSKG